MARGKLIIVFGSTGSGKSILIEHVRNLFPDLVFVKSYTTRPKRSAVENASYEFVTVPAFTQMRDAGEFVEWAEFSGNFYGTRKKEIEDGLGEGKLLLKEMEVQGIRQMLEHIDRNDLRLLFVDAGSWEELEQRARARGSITEEALLLRKARYEEEQPFAKEADIVVQNFHGKLDHAKQAFTEALSAVKQEIQ